MAWSETEGGLGREDGNGLCRGEAVGPVLRERLRVEVGKEEGRRATSWAAAALSFPFSGNWPQSCWGVGAHCHGVRVTKPYYFSGRADGSGGPLT